MKIEVNVWLTVTEVAMLLNTSVKAIEKLLADMQSYGKVKDVRDKSGDRLISLGVALPLSDKVGTHEAKQFQDWVYGISNGSLEALNSLSRALDQ